jgi:hypothetical protein
VIDALKTIVIRLALCAAVTWCVWRAGFNTGVMFMAGLLGVALARPLLDLAIALRYHLRRAVWRDVQGRHFAYKGRPLKVIEDADHRRWIRLADIRAIAGFTASNTALQVTYPSGWRKLGRPAEPFLCDESLLAHLAKERTPENLRLRHWVEREIVFPARRKREHAGIKLEALDFRSSSD